MLRPTSSFYVAVRHMMPLQCGVYSQVPLTLLCSTNPSMKTLCICKICNCGRHRCPHRPTALHRKGTMGGVSEYTHKYPGYEGYLPPKSLKPHYEYKDPKEKMESTTTTRANYVEYEIISRPVKKRVPYQPKPGTMDHNTTYRVQYKPYYLQPVEPTRPKHNTLMGSGKMDGESTYQKYFRQWEQSKRELLKPDNAYKPSKQSFSTSTTYRQNYQGLAGPMAKSFKPDYVKVGSDEPIQSSTEFRDQYREWPVSLRTGHKAQKYKGPTTKMDLCSTTHNDYIKPEMQLIKPVRPIINLTLSTDPFSDRTTTRDDYRPWAIKCRKPLIRSDELPKAKGKMENLTTFRANFTQKALQKIISCKPLHAPLMTDAPTGKTTYHTEYTPKEVTLCPARLECPDGFVFMGVNEKGHKCFRELSVQEKLNSSCHVVDPNDVVLKLTELE